MSQTITVFSETTTEYKRLNAAANLIQAETGKEVKVSNVLFDAGQNWKWTTLLMESGLTCSPYFQLLDPKQHKLIVQGSTEEWFETVKEIIAKETKNG